MSVNTDSNLSNNPQHRRHKNLLEQCLFLLSAWSLLDVWCFPMIYILLNVTRMTCFHFLDMLILYISLLSVHCITRLGTSTPGGFFSSFSLHLPIFMFHIPRRGLACTIAYAYIAILPTFTLGHSCQTILHVVLSTLQRPTTHWVNNNTTRISTLVYTIQ